jgi:hypothetical protein
LLEALSVDVQLLWLQTVALARAELQASIRGLVYAAAGVAVGVVLAAAGLLAIVSALVLGGVALGLPPWAAAAVVGVLIAAAGGITVLACVKKAKGLHFNLEDTRTSVAETLTWLRTQAFR